MPRPLVAGGNGANRTLPLAARYAGERNAGFVSAKRFFELRAHLDELLRAAGPAPGLVRRRLMTGVVFGRTVAEVERKLGGEPREQLRAERDRRRAERDRRAPRPVGRGWRATGDAAVAGGRRHRWSGGIRAVGTIAVKRACCSPALWRKSASIPGLLRLKPRSGSGRLSYTRGMLLFSTTTGLSKPGAPTESFSASNASRTSARIAPGFRPRG